MQSLVDAYNNAQHWFVRRQIVAIGVADFPAYVIKQYVPNISDWKTKSTPRHAYCRNSEKALSVVTLYRLLRLGRGAVVQTSRASTIRYTKAQVKHFIDFILSLHITSDLHFGKKKMKLRTSETVVAPKTIRNMIV
jgi:hypothetical protein